MKTSTQKGFIIPLIGGIIALLIAGGIYWAWHNKAANAPYAQNGVVVQNDAAASSTILTATSTADWKTYINAQYGFTFKYPIDQGLIIEEQMAPYGSALVPSGAILNSQSPRQLFMVMGSLSNVKDVSDIGKGMTNVYSQNTTHSDSQTAIDGKSAAVHILCQVQSQACSEIVYVINPAPQTVEGQTVYRMYTIQFTKNPLMLEILSTFKFTN
jgi:hypothetical protein